MADTEFTICNGALGRLGLSSITDFTSNDKSKICGAIYPKYVNTLLAMYPWRFARKKSSALTATTAPTYGRQYAYTLPTDFITIVNVYSDLIVNPVARTDYEIFGSVLHSDASTVYIDYIFEVDEDLWPDWFQNFAMSALASVLAIPLTEDDNKENFWRQLSFGTPQENGEGGIFKQCKGIDARNQPIKRLKGQSLLAARFS